MTRQSHIAAFSVVFAITAAAAQAPAPPAAPEPVRPPEAARVLEPPPGFHATPPELDGRWAAAAAALLYALEWSRE
jgi:hypothetical protein